MLALLHKNIQNKTMENIWESIYPILNSRATTTLIALIAALGAFLIYFLRRRDYKKDAANIILLEIKNAERNLDEARKSYEEARSDDPQRIVFPEKLRLMSTESWTKYKYLFVRDFTTEQWDEIGSFYENCRYFDEAVEIKDSSFNLNLSEIRASIQRNVGIYSRQLADEMTPNPDLDLEIEKNNQQLIDKYRDKKNNAVDANLDHLIEPYSADKPYKDAAYYFNLLPMSLVNTTTGSRLKQLASRRLFNFGSSKL